MGKAHTDRAFEQELADLREHLLRMAGRVEQMIQRSVECFELRDATRAKDTINLDHDVNQAEIDIDEMCLVILAKRQPMGRDLRFITLALKMVTDLERIADLAVNICERTQQLTLLPPIPGGMGKGIARMAVVVQSMVKGAIEAFIDGDEARARDIVARDDEVDELYHAIFRDVLARMVEAPALIEQGIHIQSVAKFLERMGDHTTNLAEQVVLLERGLDIRHAGKL